MDTDGHTIDVHVVQWSTEAKDGMSVMRFGLGKNVGIHFLSVGHSYEQQPAV